MKQKIYLLTWTILIPVLAWLAYFGSHFFSGTFCSAVLSLFLIGSVLAAVYHSEIIAYRVGEPFGTLLLAFAITVIEVALIISIMLGAKGLETITLARDTVYAAVMIILTGIIGGCIIVGSVKELYASGREYGTYYADVHQYLRTYFTELYHKPQWRGIYFPSAAVCFADQPFVILGIHHDADHQAPQLFYFTGKQVSSIF